MPHSLTAEDVLKEIEFELVQGAISKDDLGRAIQEVKRYQNKLRSEVFQPGQDMPQLRELTGRQFQFNDMVITLLQEMAAAMQEMQLKTKRLSRWQQSPPVTGTASQVSTAPQKDDSIWRDDKDLHAALQEDLEVELEMRPTSVPLVGSFLQRFKHEMHALVVFYLRKLAGRQVAVNRTYGEWALYFDALHQHHQAEIHQLRMKIAALEAQRETRRASEES